MNQLWIGKKKMTKVKLSQKVSKTLPKIGKNNALKKYHQFILNASCYLLLCVQFYEVFSSKMIKIN